MIFARSLPPTLCAFGFLLAASCSSSSAIERSREFARLADYQHAYEVLDSARSEYIQQGDTVPERLAQEHEKMRRRALLDRARSRIFGEDEDGALRDLDRLAVVDPNYPELDTLRNMALRKKAKRIVRRSDELLRAENFADAMKGYLESQRLVPGFKLADKGIALVEQRLARMGARAQKQFLQAVRKVPEFRHIEVAWHANSVIRHSPDPTDEQREEAQRLQQRARHESALDMMRRGEACERADKFGAALVHFREAKSVDEELEGIDESIKRMEAELVALGLLEKAQLLIRSEEFDAADEVLKEALEVSTLSRGMISEVMIQTRKRRGDQAYRMARDLEVMGRKDEALAAFRALMEKWPAGVEDEKARAASLEVDVEGAKEEWRLAEEAEAAGKLEEALDHFVNAERFFASWRDGEVQIERLKKAIAAAQTASEAEAGAAGGGSN
ncbi:MAG: hypothetical protein AB8H80_11125 [Planctomycetota bacterium]